MDRPNAESPSCFTLSAERRAELALVQAPLEQARTLPPWAYVDPGFYAAEESFVLRREWLSVGRVDEIPEPGDYFTTRILREPLIVVRGEGGEIRTLSAVCRHRGAVVASDRGHAKRFVCPYHSWSYDTNGRLLGAAKMKGNDGFRKKDCALPQVRTETWQGWIFINFDPDAEPLAPRLEPLDAVIAPYRVPELRTAVPPLVYDQHYNWKLLTDNWENYHGLGTHAKSLVASGNYTADSVFPWESREAYAIWLNPFKAEFPSTLVPIPDLPPDRRRGLVGVHVFPCHLFLLMPEYLIYFKILPESVDYFRLEAGISVMPEVVDDPAFEKALVDRREGLDYIHGQEDVPVLERCQAGVRGSLAEQGYLSPEERSLWHFYNYLIPRVLEGIDGKRSVPA